MLDDLSGTYSVRKTIAIALLSLTSVMAINPMAVAQVTFDGTLGNVAPGEIPRPGEGFTYRVQPGQGLQAGNTNLFHSFSQFNLNSLESIRFENPGVANIVTRVTGGSTSNISGLISVAGDPDFYLINPSGIVFNQGAALDVRGAFVVSTSPGLFFNDGNIEFRALNPQAIDDAFLSIAEDPGGFNQIGRVEDITLANTFLSPQGVRLGFDADVLNVLSSAIKGDEGRLVIDSNSVNVLNSSLDFPNGLIQITANNNVVLVGSQLITATTGAQPAGGIAIIADNFLADNSALFANSEPGTTGSAGLILIQGNTLLFDNNTELQAQTSGSGQAGVIALRTDSQGVIVFDNSSTAFSSVEGDGESFNIGVPDVFDSDLSGFFISSDFLEESARDFNNFNIVIDTGTLILNDGSQLQTLVRGESSNGVSSGDAGWIGISANDVLITSDQTSQFPSAIFSSIGEGALQDGAAGAIILDVENLLLDRGVISTSIASDGTPGLIGILADGDVVLQNGSAVASATLEGANANPLDATDAFPGAIVLGANRLAVDSNSEVSVTNLGSGFAGDIAIFAGLTVVSNNSAISAETTGIGQGGNIEIAGDFLILAEDSNVTTDSGGDGGNIFLDINRIIYGTPSRDSNILARGGALGGNITFSDRVFLRNIAPRDADFLTSNDITPTGAITQGTVGFQSGTQDLNPVQEQVTLPANLIDASRLIAQGCAAGNLTAAEEIGELVVTGRGGVPPAPGEQVSDAGNVPSLVDVPNMEPGELSSVPPIAVVPLDELAAAVPPSRLSEAQGWRYAEGGAVVLTASAETATPTATFWRLPGCDDAF